ncbi:MAG: ketoacyl-ACP synthase III [Sphaerochaetaceae bacterium]|nr:ketoacyl-ACP synthase III [Sphaerochaetaceae bacterium]MDC7249189.1 ketoacyl-ACP synthase III [Sphaerochaetaceae bacterium]
MKEDKSIKITALGSYLPEKIVTNDNLSEIVDTNDDWIVSHTGIKERRYASKQQKASDLAINAIKNMNVNIEDVDAIIVATATPDYYGFPSTACIISEKLKLKNVNIAFDLTAGCTGFIYALENAKALIIAKSAKKVLVIGSEILSRVVDFSDRNTCVLFADGAGCALVESGNGPFNSILGVEKKGSDKLFIDDKSHINMEGRAVYNFAVKRIVETILNLVEKNNISLDDIDYIVSHQANIRILMAAAKRLNIDEKLFYSNVDKVANTSAASIPIALDHLNKSENIKEGSNIILVGFGAGLTYGGTFFKWKN